MHVFDIISSHYTLVVLKFFGCSIVIDSINSLLGRNE